MIIIRNNKEKEVVAALRKFAGNDDYAEKFQEVLKLKTQIEDLKISKSRLQEEHEKEDRELRHMIGLEKKRQEFEVEAAKKQTTLDVREENLKADQKRFADQLAFNTERFEKAETNLKEILSEIVKRLPNVNVEMGSRRK